jgi:hypothetical protein
MAPLKAYQHNCAPLVPSLKNTFLHVERSDDEFDLDDCSWLMRRQASEPTPMKRQLSSAARESVVRTATQLGSLDENECVEEGDENDKIESSGVKGCDSDVFDISNVFIHSGSCIKRQISASLELGTDMERQVSSLSQSCFDRQMSTLSTHGMDRQASCLSAAGFCRQVTDQAWPTYQNREPKDFMFNDPPVEEAHSVAEPCFTGLYSAPHVQEQHIAQDTEQALGSCEAPMLMPMNPLMMSYAMNPMMWQGMQSNLPTSTSEVAETSVPNQTWSAAQGKSRRKARSLVTMAQETQRQRQLEWAQQLEQQVKGSLGMQFSPEIAPMVSPIVSPFATHEELPKIEQTVQAKPAVSEDTPKKAMNFCGACGGSIKGHFKFCQFCGKPVV